MSKLRLSELESKQMNTTGKFTSRTKEEIDLLVELWKQSGKNKAIFCREQNVNYQTFIGWTIPKKSHHKKTSSFIPVRVGMGEERQTVFANIYFKNGNRVCFYEPVSADYFQSLLK